MSPDGKWIAFTSNQNQAGAEVFVVPFPGRGEVVPISTGGGREPRWNSKGTELFWRIGNKMMTV